MLVLLSSFPQRANVRHQRVDLLFREFLSVRRHLALAIHDGVEYSLIGDTALPLGIGQVSSMFEFAFQRFCSTIFSVTRSTVFAKQLSRACGADIARPNGPAAHRSARKRAAKR